MKRTNFINKKISEQSGITLVALVITIIVLLILAGVTIVTLTGNNGLLTKASQAKEAAEIGEEKEIISLSLIQAKSEKYNENLDEETFQTALDNNSKAENKAEIIESDEEGFIVRFERTKHCYEVNQDGIIDLAEGAGSKKTLTINCKDSNGTILATENYTIYKSKYSKTLPVIEGYMPEQETIMGEITGDTIKDVLYYLIIPETQMVFTGLDSSGNVTTDSSQIVSYMLGNNSSINGNGLVSTPTVLSVLIIPETHDEKPVIKIGNNALSASYKIIEMSIGNNITTIGKYAMSNCTGIKNLTIGRGLNSLGAGCFDNCRELKTVIYNNETNVISGMNPGNNWTEIKIDENNPKLKIEDNILYSKDGTTLVKVPQGRSGSFTVAEGVTKIENSALRSCYKITEVNIGNEVTTIGTYAMSSCTGMTQLIVGSGLTSVGAGCFDNCRSLKTIIYNNETNVISKIRPGNSWTELQINDGNTKLKVENNILYSKDGTTLVRVPEGRSGSFTIEEGVTKIGDNALSGCSKLTELTISNSVTTIGAYGIGGTGLTKLIIGTGLNSVGSGGFEGNKTLKTVIIDSSTIASNLSNQSSCGKLVYWATTVYTKTTPGAYILNNFSEETSDLEGYTKYVKN